MTIIQNSNAFKFVQGQTELLRFKATRCNGTMLKHMNYQHELVCLTAVKQNWLVICLETTC